MTTEMQEIAITEDKPLLTGQADTTKVCDGVIYSYRDMDMHVIQD